MPELPDLNVFSANLNKSLKGKKVKKIAVPVSDKLNVSVPALKKTLEGQVVKKVYRDGKELHFAFSGGDVLGLHLMLNGALFLFEGKNPHKTHKSTIVELLFDDETGLALTDWQKIAVVTLNPEEKDAPDALSEEINYTKLKEMLQKRSAVKKLLMEQKIIRGIGNAYADEILWDAGISPFSICNKIPDNAIKTLAKSIKHILTEAEKKIKATHPDIISGEVRDFLLIHNSKKDESPTGHKIKMDGWTGHLFY